MGKPFFRKSHKSWYLQVGKRQVRLAESRDEAFRKWHEMESGATSRSTAGPTVTSAIEEFMADLTANSSARTQEWYGMFLPLIKADKPLDALRPIDVTRVMNARPAWGQNTRHNFVRACKRLTRWARIQGLIAVDPLADMVKPTPVAREDFLTSEQMARIEAVLPDGPLLDLLVVAWDTGLRPQELFALEARHVDGDRITFRASEGKGKRVRVAYVGTDRAMAILKGLSGIYRTGPLFRNTMGNPWCSSSVKCAFRRIEKAVGFRTHLGAFRKGYCTEGLKNGVDTVTMSHLMGHASTAMVSRVYAKVHHDQEHMRNAARRVRPALSPVSSGQAPEIEAAFPEEAPETP